jgi:hypothetical protein
MKTIRFLAAILLVVTGVWHIALFFKASDDPDSLPLLIFGVAYALTGLLLFTRRKLWVYLGLIIPLTGMVAAIIKIGYVNFDLTMKVLILIDIVVIACCAYLLLTRKKST